MQASVRGLTKSRRNSEQTQFQQSGQTPGPPPWVKQDTEVDRRMPAMDDRWQNEVPRGVAGMRQEPEPQPPAKVAEAAGGNRDELLEEMKKQTQLLEQILNKIGTAWG